jgi:hypothetical protein
MSDHEGHKSTGRRMKLTERSKRSRVGEVFDEHIVASIREHAEDVVHTISVAVCHWNEGRRWTC